MKSLVPSCLSTKVKEWTAKLKFSVRFENGEKITPDDRKISLMTCSKENCPFFLQFKIEGQQAIQTS